MVGLDRTVGHKVGLGGAKGERSMRNVGFSIVLAFPFPRVGILASSYWSRETEVFLQVL